MRRARWLVRTFPFTLVGLLSFAALVLAALGVVPVRGLGRIAILPAYITGLLAVMGGVSLFGAEGPVPGWFLAASLPLRLAPFLAADYVLA
jgi:hypothetical protein